MNCVLKDKPLIDWQNVCYLIAGVMLGIALAFVMFSRFRHVSETEGIGMPRQYQGNR